MEPQEKIAAPCPQRHCFFWLEKGDAYASGMYSSLDVALEQLQIATENRCECSLGMCIRDERLPADQKDPRVYKDFYEPCEKIRQDLQDQQDLGY